MLFSEVSNEPGTARFRVAGIIARTPRALVVLPTTGYYRNLPGLPPRLTMLFPAESSGDERPER